ISAQAIQPLPIGPNCQTEPSCAMPKCALTAAEELLNRSTVVGCRFPTIVCMTTPIMAPDPQEPLLVGNGSLYVICTGPVTRPSAPISSLLVIALLSGSPSPRPAVPAVARCPAGGPATSRTW